MVVTAHHEQLVLLQPLLRDVPGLAGPAEADAFALADGVEGESDVLANDFSIGGLDKAWGPRQITVEKVPERPLADEADAGRVLLRVVRQAGFKGDAPHFGFLHLADREKDTRDLLPVETMQEVALV